MKFTTHTLYEITKVINQRLLEIQSKDIVEFEVLNPDAVTSTYSGNIIHLDNEKFIYRGYKAWVDLAQTLYCKMLTPTFASKHTVKIRFEKLGNDSFHTSDASKEEKYGAESIFSRIHKLEEPGFLHYYTQALNNASLDKRKRILNLGVNSGDEFEAIKMVSKNFEELELVGIDYCASAIEEAKKKFSDENVSFYAHDINELDALKLGEFDLIISIGTLQSSNLDFNPLFMSIVQNYLKKDGAMILGFPNCRWIDGETIYGARAKHYNFSEMGNLYKDAVFCKKYLQQKKYRVTLTGKDYIFLTATSIRKE